MTPVAASNDRTTSAICMIILSGLLLAYATLRAVEVGITWDEAFSWLEFTRKGTLLPFGPFRAMAANNHYLNAWLTYLTTGVLGVSELTLRLPALTAFALYLYYTGRLSLELPSPLLRVSAFVVLNGNPYVLDFFSLARGYGLAYALLAGSLWYLYRFLQAGLQVRHSRASLGLAILAMAAHLTLIHFVIALTVVLVLATILLAPAGPGLGRRVAHALKVHAVGLSAVALSLAAAAFVIQKLRKVDSFFYGGTTSFWHDTLLGVFDASLYGRRYSALLGPEAGTSSFRLSVLLGALAILLMAGAIRLSTTAARRPSRPRDLYLPALVALVCGCALATIAQHQLFGVPYLGSRTGAYLLVLATFAFVFLADAVARAGRRWQYGLPVAAGFVAAHLLNCLNLTYALEWKLDADVKQMLADVAAARSMLPGVEGPTVLGMNLEFEAPLNFYRAVAGLTWLNVADRRMKHHPLSDFYLYTDSDWRAATADSLVVLKTYPLNNSRLLRRRTRPAAPEVRFRTTLDFDAPADPGAAVAATTDDGRNRGLRSGRTDERHRQSGRIDYTPDLGGDPPDHSLIEVEAMVWMQSLRNATAQLVVVFEREQRPYSWQSMTVRDGAPKARTWFPVRLTAFVPPDVRPGDRVSVYLGNRQSPVYIDDLEMRWMTAATPPLPVAAAARPAAPGAEPPAPHPRRRRRPPRGTRNGSHRARGRG